MKHEEEIDILKKELHDKYNIKTDRDLIKQLGINEEDKKKVVYLDKISMCLFSQRRFL